MKCPICGDGLSYLAEYQSWTTRLALHLDARHREFANGNPVWQCCCCGDTLVEVTDFHLRAPALIAHIHKCPAFQEAVALHNISGRLYVPGVKP